MQAQALLLPIITSNASNLSTLTEMGSGLKTMIQLYVICKKSTHVQ